MLASIQFRAWRKHHYISSRLAFSRLLMTQAATLPALLAPLALLGGFHGGLSWLAAAVIASILVALLNAWVLLVEILR